MYYERNDVEMTRGRFRLRGDTLEIMPSYEDIAIRVEFFGEDIERIVEVDTLTGELLADRDTIDIYPAKHFVTSKEKLDLGVVEIEAELAARIAELIADGTAAQIVTLSALDDIDDAILVPGMAGAKDAELLYPYIIPAQVYGILASLDAGLTPDNPNVSGTVNRVVQGVRLHACEIA